MCPPPRAGSAKTRVRREHSCMKGKGWSMKYCKGVIENTFENRVRKKDAYWSGGRTARG